MPWIIEASDDCGGHWRRAEVTGCYLHPRIAMLEALAIIEDEWHPPHRALLELTTSLQDELRAHFWEKAIRVIRAPSDVRPPDPPAARI